MPEVTFYQDLAKPNSTHIPTSVVLSGDCLLKHPTDLYNPTIVFNGDVHNATSFKLLGKYYWVTNMVSVRNGVWEVTGKKNLLASYQGNIALASGFIQYADTVDNNTIPDDRLAIEAGNYTVESYVKECPFMNKDNPYITVATCAIGSIQEYLMTSTDMVNILNPFYGVGTADIQKALGSGQEACINAIRGAFWLPFKYGSGGIDTDNAGGGNIKFGDLDTGVAKLRSSQILWRSNEIPITFVGFTDWRNVHATIQLALPLYGNVEFPVESILSNLGNESLMLIPTIYVQYCINTFSGDYTIEIYRKVANQSSGGGSNKLIISCVSGNAAVAIPVGTTLNNAAPRMIGAMAGLVGNAASGNWGAALGNTAEAYGILTHATNTSKPTAVSTGGGGSAYAYREVISATLYGKILNYTDPNMYAIKNTIGVPVMKMGTIAATVAGGTGGGYVQGCDLQITGTMTEAEREEIESLFNKGFYYVP